LSQRELAAIVGLIADHQVSTHERSLAIPSLLVALSYEAIFGVPVADLFAGIHETILQGVEERLRQLEETLQDSTAKGRAAHAIAWRLEWLCERRSAIPPN
jgi:DNA-binding XRE family transcriptional regulator